MQVKLVIVNVFGASAAKLHGMLVSPGQSCTRKTIDFSDTQQNRLYTELPQL